MFARLVRRVRLGRMRRVRMLGRCLPRLRCRVFARRRFVVRLHLLALLLLCCLAPLLLPGLVTLLRFHALLLLRFVALLRLSVFLLLGGIALLQRFALLGRVVSLHFRALLLLLLRRRASLLRGMFALHRLLPRVVRRTGRMRHRHLGMRRIRAMLRECFGRGSCTGARVVCTEMRDRHRRGTRALLKAWPRIGSAPGRTVLRPIAVLLLVTLPP